MQVTLRPKSIEDYRTFLRAKTLPRYSVAGRVVRFPDEYASRIGVEVAKQATSGVAYRPSPFLFDYQAAITAMAIEKQKFAIFADCGLGKSLMYFEYMRYVRSVLPRDRGVLMVTPLMVVRQMIDEVFRFYGDTLPIRQITAKELPAWTSNPTPGVIGITNYEAITDKVTQGKLGALVLDESSMLKSHYGKWGTRLIELGKGLNWKLAGTGTPAPNDRIEYANHGVFCDQFPTVNSFLARYFVNRGETGERWELKPHAMRPFYRSLSHWSIFLTDPSVYGWRDNVRSLPPIHVHIDDVPLTPEQLAGVAELDGVKGGIVRRSKLGQLAKGRMGDGSVSTLKPAYVRQLVESWPDESTIIWCLYNAEQDLIAEQFPDAADVSGDTPHDEREYLVDEFKSGRCRVLISKPKVLGFGLNLQIATRHVFSGLQDSYESYYQAVKRSNRYGSTRPLNVHIPVTSIERPMIETVIKKAGRVATDAAEQEKLFKEAMV